MSVVLGVTALYCLVGGVTKYKSGNRGKQMVPNIEFWGTLPGNQPPQNNQNNNNNACRSPFWLPLFARSKMGPCDAFSLYHRLWLTKL